jgi:hypothetical protein
MVAPETLDAFTGISGFHFVFGNNEYDHPALRARAAALSLHCHDHYADLTLAAKRVALLHGHDDALLHRTTRSGDFQYVVHGHTHLRKDQRVAGTRVINPGALQRAKVKSVALLDLTTDELRFLELPPQNP